MLRNVVSLYPFQSTAYDEIRRSIGSGIRKMIVCSPTGSGKTVLACAILQACESKHSHVLFIVDRISLVDQTSDQLYNYGIGHGCLQAGHPNFRSTALVQVCSAQTMERRGIPENVDVVIVDEAHCMRKFITEFLKRTGAVVIGLTATPFTRGLADVYDGIVNVATMNQLLADGYLVPLKIYAAKSIDVKGMKIVAGEWSDRDIEERGMAIIGDIVAGWQDKTEAHFGGPAKTIAFSATVDHGAELVKQFREAGFNFEQISYKDKNDAQRRAIIQEFRKPESEIIGLVSCEVFTKGFDVPDVMVGISARPYRRGFSSHLQQMGRVMRRSPGKEHGLWLDHSGNAMRFWKDTEDFFENGVTGLSEGAAELDAKAREEPTEREREEIRCKCGYVLPPGVRKCPQCGVEKIKLSTVETAPGELVELTRTQKSHNKESWESKREFMAGLRGVAAQHGYKDGWVSHTYKAKYGVFPNDPMVRNVTAGPITADVRSYVTALNIRRARARRAA